MRKKILLIEYENEDLTDRIATFLSKEGFNVVKATGTREAIAKLDSFEPELVILGNAESGDVYKVCHQLRQLADALIIMLGTVEGGEAWIKSVDSGADFYLVSPFSYIELCARIKSMLRRYESHKCSSLETAPSGCLDAETSLSL